MSSSLKSTLLYLITVDEMSLKWAKNVAPHHQKPFGSKKRADRYLLGRALLEQMILHHYQIAPPLRFEYAAKGKPSLLNAPEISFNLSHSDSLLALTIGKKGPLGVDIEDHQPRKSFDALLKRTFSPEEREWIESSPHFLSAFFALWSGKEAYLKADGRGLSALKSLILKPKVGELSGDLKEHRLYIAPQFRHTALPTQTHALAVATDEMSPPPIYELTIEESGGDFTLIKKERAPSWDLILIP